MLLSPFVTVILLYTLCPFTFLIHTVQKSQACVCVCVCAAVIVIVVVLVLLITRVNP